MPDVVKVGDTVVWRGCFGSEPPQKAKVETLEITKEPHTKYGREVKEADWASVYADCVVFGLDNGHWAYGCQISKMEA